jgi:hypothetical protein
MFDVLSSGSVRTAVIVWFHDSKMDSVIMDILSDIHEPQRVTSIKNHQEENPGAVCQALES